MKEALGIKPVTPPPAYPGKCAPANGHRPGRHRGGTLGHQRQNHKLSGLDGTRIGADPAQAPGDLLIQPFRKTSPCPTRQRRLQE